MKMFLLLITIFVFTSISVTKAQFNQGDFEFSFSGSFSSMTAENSSNSPYYNSNTSSDTRSTMYIGFSPGYYIFNGISIEAEFGVSAVEKSKPAQYILFNLGLTHLFPGTKVALFVHGGYGLSNSVAVPYLNNALFMSLDKFDIKVLNLGAGFKFLASSTVILHAEINYREHKWTENYTLYHVDNKISNIGLFLGFSILI